MEDDLLGQAQAVLSGSTPKGGDLLSEAMDVFKNNKPDPKFAEQEGRMQQARVWANQKRGGEKEFGFGLGLRLRTRDLSLPFQGVANSIARGIAGVENDYEKKKKAEEAFAAGKATDEQLARLALYEYEDARNKSLGTAAAIGQGVAHAAPVVGEALVGGQAVKGIGQAVGLGAKMAPAATMTGRMGQSAAVQAAATPLTPGLWLDESQQRAAENGGNWYDPKNVAAPMVKAAFQNAIMGHLGEGTKGLGIAKRVGLGAALMPAEQAGADALTTLAERGWKEAGMDEKWATKTEWGTIGQFMRGESGEGLKSLATQATLGGLFAGFHGQKSDPVGKLGKAVDSLAKDGVPQDLGVRVIDEATRRPPETIKNQDVKAFVESIIGLKQVEKPELDDTGRKIRKDILDPLGIQEQPEAIKPRPSEAAAEPVRKAPEAKKAPDSKSGDLLDVRKLFDAKHNGDVGAAAADVVGQVQKHLDSGGKVTAWYEGRPIQIARIDNGMMQDAKGQRWGIMALLQPSAGVKSGIEFQPVEAQKTAPAKPQTAAEALEALGIDPGKPWVGDEAYTPPVAKPVEVAPVEKPKKKGLGKKVKPEEAAKPVESIEEVERRIMEGKGPDGAERRRPTGLKLGQAEPITIDNARVSEIGDLDKFGKDHFRIDITDSEGAKVGELRLGAVGDTLHAPVGFADGLEFGKGRGKDQPFGSAEIMSLVEQVAMLDPTAKKLVFTPSKGRIRAGVEKEFNLDKIRERVAKRAEKEAAQPVEEPKQETASEPIPAERPAQEGTRVEEARPAEPVSEPEGFGRTMTPEERSAGQVGGGAYGADELPRMDGGLKELALANANVDAERVSNGLQPLMSRARATFGEVWDQAMVKLGMDPNLSADLVNGLEKKMRNISTEESALLLHRRIQFSNEYERTIRQANAAAMKNDWNGFERFDNRAKELLEQTNRLDRVMRDVGTEAGRTLAFRRQLAAEDYSLTRMMGEMTRAKKSALTPEEMQKVQDQADRIQRLEERIRDFEAKEAAEADVIDLQPAEQKGLFQKAKEWLGSLFPRQRPTLGAAKKSKTWEFAERMEQDAVKEIMAKYGPGKLFSGFDPTGIPALAKYTAAKIIKSGLTFADFSSQIIARFGDAVKPHIKEIWDSAQKHVEIGRLDKVDAQVELKKTKGEYTEMVDAFKRKNQSVGRKLWEGTKETNNLMRAIQTAWDVSAVGRQGGPLGLSSPTLVPAAIKDMVKSLRSERGYERAQMEILNRKNALDYRIAELEFTDHNADPTKQEESLMGRYVQKLPGLAASSRAFNGYLNRLRADKFDAMALNVTSTGPERIVELKAIADYINAMTGRGKTGYKRIDDATQHLAQVFFSPRHALSRFQVLSGQPFWGAGTWKAKKMIAKEYAKYAIGMAAVYGLAKAVLGSEAEIEKDPRSSDFGKIRIGRTRIDPLAGFSQSAVVATRLGLGESKMPGTNEVKDLRGPGHKFKDPTTVKVAGQFIRNKMSPLGGEVSDKLFPEFTPPGVGPLTDATGKKKGLGGWAIRQADKFQPLTAGDIYDAFKEHGIPRATAISLLNLLGWGSQVHEKQPRPK